MQNLLSQTGRHLRRWWSTISRSPAQKPPMLARELPREAAMMSTSRGCSPACSAAPRPVLPSTPSDMLSSTTSRYLYLHAHTCHKTQLSVRSLAALSV